MSAIQELRYNFYDTQLVNNTYEYSFNGIGASIVRPAKIKYISIVYAGYHDAAAASIAGCYNPIIQFKVRSPNDEPIYQSPPHIVCEVPRRVMIRIPRNTDWGTYNKDRLFLEVGLSNMGTAGWAVTWTCLVMVQYRDVATFAASEVRGRPSRPPPESDDDPLVVDMYVL